MKDFLLGENAFWNAYGEGIVIGVAIVLTIILLVVTYDQGRKGKFTTKVIANGALCLALSLVLNFISSLLPIPQMPNGGSVTIARLVPLLVFAHVYGFSRGLIFGALYGILDCLAKPFIINPFQFLLDYPIPFACVAFAGIAPFKGVYGRRFSLYLGVVIFAITRFACSTAAGVIFWSTPLLGSMAYNSVLLFDAGICFVVIFVLTCSRSFNEFLDGQRQAVKLSENNI